MKFFFLITLISLSSCTTLMQLMYGDSNIKDLSKNICLNGEGIGEIGIGDDSYSFDYQSALKKNKWLLGIQFPLRGEELLIANFKNQKYFLSGDFYQHARNKLIERNPADLETFNIFSKELAYFIEELKNIKNDPEFYEKCEKNGKEFRCKYLLINRVKKVTIWHQEGKHVAYKRKLSNSLNLVATFKYPSKQGFKQIDIKLEKVVQKRHTQTYSLQLSNKNCM